MLKVMRMEDQLSHEEQRTIAELPYVVLAKCRPGERVCDSKALLLLIHRSRGHAQAGGGRKLVGAGRQGTHKLVVDASWWWTQVGA